MGKGPKVPQSSIDTNVDLQSSEALLAKQYATMVRPGFNAASDYWTSILHGGPEAQAATAPYAQTIAQQTGAAQKQIQNTLPAGGEKNLALAELPIKQGQSIANLYQGLGPAAATNLGNLSLGIGGLSTGAAGVSAGAGASNEQLAAAMANAKGGMAGGIGQGLGGIAGNALGSKGTGTGALGGKAAGAGLAGKGAAAGGAGAMDLIPFLAAA